MAKKKAKIPADVERFNQLIGLDVNTLQAMAKKELNKARVRLQRLNKWSGGKEELLSYSARTAKGLIEPFTNKAGNVSLSTTGFNKATLINAIIRGEKFNAMTTTVKANKAKLEEEEDTYGLTAAQLIRRKRLWDIASKSGIFDYYDPSNQEESEDVYRFILEAEENGMTDDEFEQFLQGKIIIKADPFSAWGEDMSSDYSNMVGTNQLKTHGWNINTDADGNTSLAGHVGGAEVAMDGDSWYALLGG